MPIKNAFFPTRKSSSDVREAKTPSRTNSDLAQLVAADGTAYYTTANGGGGVSPALDARPGIKARSPSVGSTDGGAGEGGRRQAFGFGLGLTSLSNSVSKAGDKMSSLTRKTSNAGGAEQHTATNGATTPTHGGKGLLGPNGSPPLAAAAQNGLAGASSMAPPANPDPQLLAHYSLELNDVVNKAFIPCAPGAAAMHSATSVSGSVKDMTKAAFAAGTSGGGAAGAAALRDTVGIPTLSVISYDGKKLPDKLKVHELARVITTQLTYAASVDAYLLRAVARQILKALTLFATRLDSLLVPATKDPNILRIPSNPKEGRILPPAMEFNVGLVAIEWIVEDALERCIEGDEFAGGRAPMPRFVSDILTPVRKHMEATILHVIQPILAGTKASIKGCLLKAVLHPFVPTSLLQNGVPSSVGLADRPRTPQVAPTTPHAEGTANSLLASPSLKSVVVSPGDISPTGKQGADAASADSKVWLKELDARLSGCRRLLVARIENRTSKDGEGWFISVAIYLIWKALFVLSARHAEPLFLCSTLGPGCAPCANEKGSPSIGALADKLGASSASIAEGFASAAKRSPSPAQLSSALKAVALTSKPRRSDSADSRSGSGAVTPNGTCRQPVPDGGFFRCRRSAQVVADLQAADGLLREFCSGFINEPVRRSNLATSVVAAGEDGDEDAESSSSDEDDEEDELARAALAEALQGLKSIITCVQVLEINPRGVALALRPRGAAPREPEAAAQQQVLPADTTRAFKAAPPLILLHILFNRLPMTSGRIRVPAPHEAFGLSWAEYEQSVGGFVAGHTWADALLNEWKPFVEANLKELREKVREMEKQQADSDAAAATASPAPAASPRAELECCKQLLAEPAPAAASDRALSPKGSPECSRRASEDHSNAQLTDSVASLDKGGKEISREPSPDGTADGKEKTRPPRFWRTNSSNTAAAPRSFSIPGLTRAASPRGRGDGQANALLIGSSADAATAMRLAVEEARAELRTLDNFVANLEALALYMGKQYSIDK